MSKFSKKLVYRLIGAILGKSIGKVLKGDYFKFIEGIADQKQDRETKKWFARWMFIVFVVQLVVLNVIFFLVGLEFLNYESWDLKTFIGGTIVEIVAVMFIIAKNLFPAEKNLRTKLSVKTHCPTRRMSRSFLLKTNRQTPCYPTLYEFEKGVKQDIAKDFKWYALTAE